MKNIKNSCLCVWTLHYVPLKLVFSTYCFTERINLFSPALFLIPSNSVELKSGFIHFLPYFENFYCVLVSQPFFNQGFPVFFQTVHISLQIFVSFLPASGMRLTGCAKTAGRSRKGLPTYPNRFSDASASLLLRITVPKSEERTNKERRRNEQNPSQGGFGGKKWVYGYFMFRAEERTGMGNFLILTNGAGDGEGKEEEMVG